MRVLLEPVSIERAPTLRNLFELYAHDFSEYVPLALGANGRFDVVMDERWWSADDHFPFFIRKDDALSGFALARRGSRVTADRDPMDVAEFFVVRGARGKNVGTSAAHALFAAFPGRWEIRVRRVNAPAVRFWAKTVEAWQGRHAPSASFTSGGVEWDLFRTQSPPR